MFCLVCLRQVLSQTEQCSPGCSKHWVDVSLPLALSMEIEKRHFLLDAMLVWQKKEKISPEQYEALAPSYQMQLRRLRERIVKQMELQLSLSEEERNALLAMEIPTQQFAEEVVGTVSLESKISENSASESLASEDSTTDGRMEGSESFGLPQKEGMETTVVDIETDNSNVVEVSGTVNALDAVGALDAVKTSDKLVESEVVVGSENVGTEVDEEDVALTHAVALENEESVGGLSEALLVVQEQASVFFEQNVSASQANPRVPEKVFPTKSVVEEVVSTVDSDGDETSILREGEGLPWEEFEQGGEAVQGEGLSFPEEANTRQEVDFGGAAGAEDAFEVLEQGLGVHVEGDGDAVLLPNLAGEAVPLSPEATKVQEESNWSRYMRPFLTQNWLYFLGTFLVLASGFYLLSSAWTGMSSWMRQGVIWGGLGGGAFAFAGMGAFLNRRLGVEQAGRIFWLVGAGLLGSAGIAAGEATKHSVWMAMGLIALTLGGNVFFGRWLGRFGRGGMHRVTASSLVVLTLFLGLIPMGRGGVWTPIWMLLLCYASLWVLWQAIRQLPVALGQSTEGSTFSVRALTRVRFEEAENSLTHRDSLLFLLPVVYFVLLCLGFAVHAFLQVDSAHGLEAWLGPLFGLFGVLVLEWVWGREDVSALRAAQASRQATNTSVGVVLAFVLGLLGVAQASKAMFPFVLGALCLCVLVGLIAFRWRGRVWFGLLFASVFLLYASGVRGVWSLVSDSFAWFHSRNGLLFFPCLAIFFGGVLVLYRSGYRDASRLWQRGFLVAALVFFASFFWTIHESSQALAWGGLLYVVLFLGLAHVYQQHRLGWVGLGALGVWWVFGIGQGIQVGFGEPTMRCVLVGSLCCWVLARQLEPFRAMQLLRSLMDEAVLLAVPVWAWLWWMDPMWGHTLTRFAHWVPSTHHMLLYLSIGMVGWAILEQARRSGQRVLAYLSLGLLGVSIAVVGLAAPRWLGRPVRPWLPSLVLSVAAWILFVLSSWIRVGVKAIPNRLSLFGRVSGNESVEGFWSAPLRHASYLSMGLGLVLLLREHIPLLVMLVTVGLSALLLVWMAWSRQQYRFGYVFVGVVCFASCLMCRSMGTFRLDELRQLGQVWESLWECQMVALGGLALLVVAGALALEEDWRKRASFWLAPVANLLPFLVLVCFGVGASFLDTEVSRVGSFESSFWLWCLGSFSCFAIVIVLRWRWFLYLGTFSFWVSILSVFRGESTLLQILGLAVLGFALGAWGGWIRFSAPLYFQGIWGIWKRRRTEDGSVLWGEGFRFLSLTLLCVVIGLFLLLEWQGKSVRLWLAPVFCGVTALLWLWQGARFGTRSLRSMFVSVLTLVLGLQFLGFDLFAFFAIPVQFGPTLLVSTIGVLWVLQGLLWVCELADSRWGSFVRGRGFGGESLSRVVWIRRQRAQRERQGVWTRNARTIGGSAESGRGEGALESEEAFGEEGGLQPFQGVLFQSDAQTARSAWGRVWQMLRFFSAWGVLLLCSGVLWMLHSEHYVMWTLPLLCLFPLVTEQLRGSAPLELFLLLCLGCFFWWSNVLEPGHASLLLALGAILFLHHGWERWGARWAIERRDWIRLGRGSLGFVWLVFGVALGLGLLDAIVFFKLPFRPFQAWVGTFLVVALTFQGLFAVGEWLRVYLAGEEEEGVGEGQAISSDVLAAVVEEGGDFSKSADGSELPVSEEALSFALWMGSWSKATAIFRFWYTIFVLVACAFLCVGVLSPGGELWAIPFWALLVLAVDQMVRPRMGTLLLLAGLAVYFWWCDVLLLYGASAALWLGLLSYMGLQWPELVQRSRSRREPLAFSVAAILFALIICFAVQDGFYQLLFLPGAWARWSVALVATAAAFQWGMLVLRWVDPKMVSESYTGPLVRKAGDWTWSPWEVLWKVSNVWFAITAFLGAVFAWMAVTTSGSEWYFLFAIVLLPFLLDQLLQPNQFSTVASIVVATCLAYYGCEVLPISAGSRWWFVAFVMGGFWLVAEGFVSWFFVRRLRLDASGMPKEPDAWRTANFYQESLGRASAFLLFVGLYLWLQACLHPWFPSWFPSFLQGKPTWIAQPWLLVLVPVVYFAFFLRRGEMSRFGGLMLVLASWPTVGASWFQRAMASSFGESLGWPEAWFVTLLSTMLFWAFLSWVLSRVLRRLDVLEGRLHWEPQLRGHGLSEATYDARLGTEVFAELEGFAPANVTPRRSPEEQSWSERFQEGLLSGQNEFAMWGGFLGLAAFVGIGWRLSEVGSPLVLLASALVLLVLANAWTHFFLVRGGVNWLLGASLSLVGAIYVGVAGCLPTEELGVTNRWIPYIGLLPLLGMFLGWFFLRVARRIRDGEYVRLWLPAYLQQVAGEYKGHRLLESAHWEQKRDQIAVRFQDVSGFLLFSSVSLLLADLLYLSPWKVGVHHPVESVFYLLSLLGLAWSWVRFALASKREFFLYLGIGSLFGFYAYLRVFLGVGIEGMDAWVLFVLGFVFVGFREVWQRMGGAMLQRALFRVSLVLPLVVLGLALSGDEPVGRGVWMASGLFYGVLAFQQKMRWLYVPAFVFANIEVIRGLMQSGFAEPLRHPQWYALPIGFTLVAFSAIFARGLGPQGRNTLRILGGGMMYLSSLIQIVTFHQITDVIVLVVLSIVGVVAGIALQIRSYLYLGAGFLMANVVFNLFRLGLADRVIGMVFLFCSGLLLLVVAVFFNLKREEILARLESMRNEMAKWD